MKQLIAIISGIAVILLVLSCGSVDLSKKYPNMVANIDPFSIGTAEVQFDRFFSSKVKKVEIEAVFHPRLNAVSLEFRYEIYKFRQFWDESARKQFAASLELYKKDFDEKKLIDKHRRTKAVYGNVKGRLEWEIFQYTKTRVSKPSIELGYRFKEKTPFYSTLMRAAREIQEEGDTSSILDSQPVYMYFTRAQADQLVMLFDQTYLIGLLKERTNDIIDKSADTETDKDTYEAPKDNYREFGEK
jgi:hypothetical protein